MVDHAANSQGSANAGAYASRLGAGWSTIVGAGRISRRWGTLASVDLSGFTRLSERLARHDAAGAEVVVPAGEFTSVTFPVAAQAHRGVRVREVPVGAIASEITAVYFACVRNTSVPLDAPAACPNFT